MNPKVFAFYLPQFHPFPENDEWWGKGFTEWTNVGKAKRLFPGHYQPHVPADLGYYDLRVPETRIAQAEMAKKYGITAFCYYHYWFGDGKQLLEMPLNEVVRTGKPNFPFFVCWANHSWENKNWNSDAQNGKSRMLIKQEYLGLDDVKKQFDTLLPIFKDPRYYRIKGKLPFVIYRADLLPYYEDYCKLFNQLAKENGLPGFYFMSNVQSVEMLEHPANKYMDANFLCTQGVAFGSPLEYKIRRHLSMILKLPLLIVSYKKAIKKLLCEKHKENLVYPVILPNWDHSPRLGYSSTIFNKSTPALWKRLLYKTVDYIKNKPEEDQIIMIKSWNEWAEGNHLEPDLKWGLKYLEAIKEVLDEKR